MFALVVHIKSIERNHLNLIVSEMTTGSGADTQIESVLYTVLVETRKSTRMVAHIQFLIDQHIIVESIEHTEYALVRFRLP